MSIQQNGKNRLQYEQSPYLLQHASNPVDWRPWGDEAFRRARREDKPIFLSIGYSTCHWCHVMERESFEDESVAELLNEHFVCIKVDREERPDIDMVYMDVCRMMSPSCGWPLNLFLTPDRLPFFAATYIPKESRFGRTGMLELIPAVGNMWIEKRGDVLSSAEKISKAIQGAQSESQGREVGEEVLDKAFRQLEALFDEECGGFGSAPKFPSPHNLLFLLRYWRRSGNAKALEMVERTLQSMRRGGIYDHLGFGLHRYSTDAKWLLPHFEKMLYDQALSAMAYCEAYQATKKKEYRSTAEEIFAYVLRDMTSVDGPFFSAEDADSEGEEGKFYVWTEAEIRKALKGNDADLALVVFNVERSGNFADEASGRKTGANILHLSKPLSATAEELGIEESDLKKRIEKVRSRLFEVRKDRARPLKDDKVLADWNGLMIAALAKGAAAFSEPKYSEAAARAANFILEKMRDSGGLLLHRFRDGHAAIPAFADDYAFMIWGLIELYEATLEAKYLKSAFRMNTEFLERFWDEESGGFFFTSNESEELLVRKKEIYDGATPSASSVALLNLLRLGRMTGDSELEGRSAAIVKQFSAQISRTPEAFTQLLNGLDFALGPAYEVVVVGNYDAEDTKEMLHTIRDIYRPNMVLLFKSDGETEDPQHTVVFADYMSGMRSIDGKATAHVCRNYSCAQPSVDPQEVVELLNTAHPPS